MSKLSEDDMDALEWAGDPDGPLRVGEQIDEEWRADLRDLINRAHREIRDLRASLLVRRK